MNDAQSHRDSNVISTERKKKEKFSNLYSTTTLTPHSTCARSQLTYPDAVAMSESHCPTTGWGAGGLSVCRFILDLVKLYKAEISTTIV